MASVFRKLISKELGDVCYDRYFACYQKLIADKAYNHHVLENEEIYTDMYLRLKDKDLESLNKMMKNLSEAMFYVLRISKTFKFTVCAYIIGVLLLLFLGVNFWIGIASIGVLTIAFFYKVYEFIVNKYCFIDAHIVIIYKSVLDRLILKHSL
ncbi:MAG: hypothetical protein Q4G58_02565 [bacterium]|nr:hypothetical protein [bacterium]